MTLPELADFRDRLRRNGIAGRTVERAVLELQTHYEELLDRATGSGLSATDAEQSAVDRLGSTDELAAAFVERPDLRSLSRRHAGLAYGLGPLIITGLACALVIAASVAAGNLLLVIRGH